jgi:hypothetical protein
MYETLGSTLLSSVMLELQNLYVICRSTVCRTKLARVRQCGIKSDLVQSDRYHGYSILYHSILQNLNIT